MVVADLHLHTTNSDGTLTLGRLPGVAREADLDAVAVTDHDRVHPAIEQPVFTRDGLTIIHGIELRVQTDRQRIDLLGYGVERTDELVDLVEGLQTNRVERARAIVDCVESRLDVDLEVTFEPGVGRPHIARAIAESDAPQDYQRAFDELIADGRPCYVSRDIPSFAEGRQILAEACGVVGLAHPFRYDDPDSALDRARDLDAIELYYPYGRTVDTTPAAELADEEGLLVTGGSDAHEETLGLAGLDQTDYARLRERLDG
jgi:predicted metal-dependent phosphoesterase TrpH